MKKSPLWRLSLVFRVETFLEEVRSKREVFRGPGSLSDQEGEKVKRFFLVFFATLLISIAIALAPIAHAAGPNGSDQVVAQPHLSQSKSASTPIGVDAVLSGNRGTIKVDINVDPSQGPDNDPWLTACTFVVSGYAENTDVAKVEFFAWDPTGNHQSVLTLPVTNKTPTIKPSGKGIDWTLSVTSAELATGGAKFTFTGGPHPEIGPYAHIKIVAEDASGKHLKSKVIWIPSCQPTVTPTSTPTNTLVPPTTTSTSVVPTSTPTQIAPTETPTNVPGSTDTPTATATVSKGNQPTETPTSTPTNQPVEQSTPTTTATNVPINPGEQPTSTPTAMPAPNSPPPQQKNPTPPPAAPTALAEIPVPTVVSAPAVHTTPTTVIPSGLPHTGGLGFSFFLLFGGVFTGLGTILKLFSSRGT